MPPSSSSSSLLLPLLMVLLPRGGAADCSSVFRSGQRDFVLDAKASVRYGAALLGTVYVHSEDECKDLCCGEPHCNLALIAPRGTGDAENRSCDLFNCIYRNQFVCAFVNQAGYLSLIREPVFQKYLGEPRRRGRQAPPIANAGRDVVVQPGETVLLDAIESMALGDAEIVEYTWSLERGDESVVMEETDIPEQRNLSNLLPGIYVFKLTITDSNEEKADDTIQVLVLNPEQSSLYCLTLMKAGPCRAAFPRWYYNAANGTCQRFAFGGCKPNKNNYLSNEECTAACRGVTATSERSVTLPTSVVCDSTCHPDQLVCDGSCCLDRSLECDGVKHCKDGADEAHCNKLNQTFSRLLSIDIDPRKARCTQPQYTGPCRAFHTRWYYDPVRKKCYSFTYGGCHANDNNFEKEETCSSSCDGVTDSSVFSRGMFERYESDDEAVGGDGGDEDDSNSGQVALAVSLTVAILALLAVMTYCILKARRERTHRPVATSPAPVPLSEQDALVYNSTTKPV